MIFFRIPEWIINFFFVFLVLENEGLRHYGKNWCKFIDDARIFLEISLRRYIHCSSSNEPICKPCSDVPWSYMTMNVDKEANFHCEMCLSEAFCFVRLTQDTCDLLHIGAINWHWNIECKNKTNETVQLIKDKCVILKSFQDICSILITRGRNRCTHVTSWRYIYIYIIESTF